MRYVVPFMVGIAVLLAACGGDGAPVAERSGAPVFAPLVTPVPFPHNTPDSRTPYPGVAPGIRSFDGQEPLPPLPEGAAVYLSLGDSLNWGCCDDPELSSHPRFAHYLSETLGRKVVWVSLAGNGTLRGFLNGELGGRPQLDAAEEAIERFREEGHDVVLISLSTGGNDLLALRGGMADGMPCVGGARPECVARFEDLLAGFPGDMYEVYSRLNAAKDDATPVFTNNYYDVTHCGQPGADITITAVTMDIFNQYVDSATVSGGAFPIDFETAFKRHACEYISGVDPTYLGYDAILGLDIEAYEALPAEYVEPWAQ
jgi:lysophospholipase L1-like esterase